jgi:hypothetical protein
VMRIGNDKAGKVRRENGLKLKRRTTRGLSNMPR